MAEHTRSKRTQYAFFVLANADSCSRLHCADMTCLMCLQAGPSEYNAVAHIDFDVEAGPSGYDAFADLVQMAIREDPSLADAAPGTGMLKG